MNTLVKNVLASGTAVVTLSTASVGIMSQSVSAFSITNDSVVGTQYSIDNVAEEDIAPNAPATSVSETYSENNLIPYTGTGGGFAIVDTDLPGGPNYFDKTITITQYDLDSEASQPIDYAWVFLAFNNTPYTWTDYHFEFEQGALQTLGLNNTSNISLAGTPGGGNISVTGDTVSFTNLSIPVGGPIEVKFFPTFTGVNVNDTFSVRQIATTASTPEPSTLLGLGLLGMGALVSRKRKG